MIEKCKKCGKRKTIPLGSGLCCCNCHQPNINLSKIDKMMKFLGKKKIDVTDWTVNIHIGGVSREIIYSAGNSTLKHNTWNEDYHNGSVDDYKSEDMEIDKEDMEIIFNKLSEECMEKARYDIVDQLAKNYLIANGIEF